jgi:tripartite-type tricarboxylate transporter receptor subunit TctC
MKGEVMRPLLGVSVLMAVVWSSLAIAAGNYPARPVRLIVGSPAGSSPDIVARLIGESLANRLHQPFVIENRPGAGSNLGAEAVVRSAPDGYTLLWVTSANAINATLYDNLTFNFIRDIEPVAGVMTVPLVMEVNPSFPAKSVPAFIAYAKANPGKINMASAGNGTPQHIAGELFKIMTGVDMVHVPYRGVTPALTDLLSGRVQVMFDALPASIEFIKAGKLRPLAVTVAARSEALPDIPTVSEFVPGYEASSWYGIGVPANTPVEIVDLLNSEIAVALADKIIKTRFADLGGAPMPISSVGFAKFIANETDKWGKVIRAANIKPE